MPRLNDNAISTKGVGICWFDNNRTIFQDCSSEVCKIVLSDKTLIKDKGCNHLFSKNGTWIAQLVGYGVFGSRNIFLPDSGIASGPSPVASDLVSPDGAICIKDLYNSFGPWHVHEANGDIWKLTDGDAHSIQLLGNRKAIYLIGNQLFKTPNLDLEIPSRLMWWPRVAQGNLGHWFLLYQDFNTGKLVLDNKVIGSPANYYRPDLTWLTNKKIIKVVWSPDESESIVISKEITLDELNSFPDIIDELPKIKSMITSPLTIDGKFFKRDGLVHRIKSVSAFKLLNRFEKREDIDPFLETYKRSNELRILLSTDPKDWGNNAWGLPSFSTILDFCNYVGSKNFDVELTLITDHDDSKIAYYKSLLNFLKDSTLKNIVIELANEPHLGKTDVNLLMNSVPSNLLYSSGIYNDNNKFFGNFINFHSARDGEWVRKFHDALEYWQGEGPNNINERALRIPSKADEPIRPDMAAFNQLDFYTYGAGLGLFCAGGCFHSQSGKLAQLPSKDELDCYHAFMDGLELFPPDAANGIYNRPIEHSLRTYSVGRFLIRVRPNGDFPFHDVYLPLDTFDICYSLDPLPPKPISIPDDEMPKHSYAAMADLNERMRAAYREGQLGKTQTDMPAMTVSHLLWRYFFEDYTEEMLISEARLRGEGKVPS